MAGSWTARLTTRLGAAAIGAFGAVSVSHAQAAGPMPQNVVPPPLSFPRAQYFKSHPQAWAQFVAGLPRLAVDAPEGGAEPTRSTPSASGGVWQLVTKGPTNGLCNPLLLTDATVMVHECDTPNWYRLVPDAKGDYADGAWYYMASLPVIGGTQYAPQYHASAVLPDGRAIIMGGEYNGGNTGVWTRLGAIYDPLANTWTPVKAPTGPAGR